MTFWIENISGAVQSLPLNGAVAIAIAGKVNLEADLDGQPANRRAAILASTELSQSVLVDGTLRLLEDDGTTPITGAAVTERLRASTQLDLDNRGAIFERGSLVLAPNVFTTVRTWPIPASTRISINIVSFDVEGLDDGTTPRGGVYSGMGKAGRSGGNSAVLIGDTFDSAENMPQDNLKFAVVGNDMVLQYKVRETISSAPYELRYFMTSRGAGTP